MPEPTLIASPDLGNGLARELVLLWRAGVAMALGAVALFVVGFAGPESIHNAAHDARHSMNFPCH
ncbi:MAG: CbtB domain-containing protein [Betaproteobacteria bacterium]